jgi:hypothetical protein
VDRVRDFLPHGLGSLDRSLDLARMFHQHRPSETVLFINTLLQRGVGAWWWAPNRFSGFRQGVETVENGFASPPGAEHPAEAGC